MRLALRVSSCAGIIGFLACSPPPHVDGGLGGGTGGAGGGAQSSAFALTTLDPDAREATYFAMAVNPTSRRVGVAYFTPAGTETNVGHPDYALRYVEWNDTVVSAPQTLRVVQNRVGLSLAFEPRSGDPVVAFLGGARSFVPGSSIFWFQNDASIMRRTNGVWAETAVAQNSVPPPCSAIDQGYLVGLWSSLVFDSTGGAYVSFRDGHNGESPMGDWAGSDVEVVEGLSTNATRRCLTTDQKEGYGGRIQLALTANDQPALVYDKAADGADTTGDDVMLQVRAPGGGWSDPQTILRVSNTTTGASLAWSADEGFGIAAVSGDESQLFYVRSDDGVTWTTSDEVFGSGSGGWYPSLAMDPTSTGTPSIAYYVCSARTFVGEHECTQSEDELRVARRTPGGWHEEVVDTEGGWAPKLGFFADGARVVVYRTPTALDSSGQPSSTAGALKLAIER